MKTIFVSIASYRDPELVPTVEDCLAHATYPERLRFGICRQGASDEPPLPWTGDPRFRILDVDWRSARGVCWARAQIMEQYDGETYFLQLDSHHRFVQGWDERAVAQLLLAGGPKPVLTTYGTPYDPKTPDIRSSIPMQMNFDRFTDAGIPIFRPGQLRGWPAGHRPTRSRFISAHFLLTIGAFVREVPYDPSIYFVGEEITLAVRAFTHGYELFHPSDVIVWHEYTREYRPHKHWTDHVEANGVAVPWHQRELVSLAAVRTILLDARIGVLGLGTDRTLADYERYAGLDFRSAEADARALGHEEPPDLRAR